MAEGFFAKYSVPVEIVEACDAQGVPLEEHLNTKIQNAEPVAKEKSMTSTEDSVDLTTVEVVKPVLVADDRYYLVRRLDVFDDALLVLPVRQLS